MRSMSSAGNAFRESTGRLEAEDLEKEERLCLEIAIGHLKASLRTPEGVNRYAQLLSLTSYLDAVAHIRARIREYEAQLQALSPLRLSALTPKEAEP